MESPTTSTCEPYRQSGQKRCRKFYARKPAKKERRTRVHAKTAEVGCVMGAGEDGNGWGRIKPDEKTRCPNQNAPDDHATHAKRKPAKTQCFRRLFGRGRRTWSPLRSGRLVACVPPARTRPSARGFGVDVGERTKERRRARCHPVPAASPRKAGAGLVLWEIFRAKTGEKEREIPEKT